MRPYILVVDDEPEIRTTVQEILEDEGYEVATAENGEEARAERAKRRPDLILLDIWMPDVDGITLLKEWASEGDSEDLPIIMMSGHGTVETAVEATRLGAYDFMEKPLSLAKLLLTLKNALKTTKLKQENQSLKTQTPPPKNPVGKSLISKQLLDDLKRIAQHDTPVLITGEAGVGKRLYAQTLHRQSARQDNPFVLVPVSSMTAENTNIELFGSEHDDQIHYGRLEQANGGTLFLEEIGDMEPETQARLMGALEGSSFLRINGHETIAPDFRIIASTQKDLEEEIRAGRFREDLYYCLNVVPLHISPLRERTDDVIELLDFYTDFFNRYEGLSYREFSMAARNQLRQYSWPGNVLELKNLVQRLLIIGDSKEISQEEVMPMLHQSIASNLACTPISDQLPFQYDLPLKVAREKFEYDYLLHHLQDTNGNVSQTAERAGIERTNLYRKLKTLGLDPKNLPKN